MDNNYAFAWSPRFGITRMIRGRVALLRNAARTSAPNFGYKDENNKELTNSGGRTEDGFGFRVSGEIGFGFPPPGLILSGVSPRDFARLP